MELERVATRLPSTLGHAIARGIRDVRPGPTLLLLLTTFLGVFPIVLLLMTSFSGSHVVGEFKNLGLDNYRDAYLSKAMLSVLANTAVYVVGSLGLGMLLTGLIAWLMERTNLPGKTLLYALILAPMAVPGVLNAIGWILLLSPRIGIVNKLLQGALKLDDAPFDIFSVGGMVLVEGLRLVPASFLLLAPLFRRMDPALEEAAIVAGCSVWRTIRKITIPLVRPGFVGVLVYMTIVVIEEFDTAAILGLPARIYLFSTRVFALAVQQSPPRLGEASALSVTYLLIAGLGVWLYVLTTRRTHRYAVVTGKGYRPRIIALGWWRWVAFAGVWVYLLVALVLPFLALLWVSFLPFIRMPSAEAFSQISLGNYREVFSLELVRGSIVNTVLMVTTAATGTVVLSFLISWVIVRTDYWGRRLLDTLAFLPRAVPGVVLGFAMLIIWLALRPVLPLYGTVWLISLGFITGFMAYGTRNLIAALLQIHKELEEAGQVAGVSLYKIFLKIYAPLLMPSLLSVWLWAALLSVRITGLPLLLLSENNQVLAVAIWLLWSEGEVGAVAALATILVSFLVMVAISLRLLALRGETSQAMMIGG